MLWGWHRVVNEMMGSSRDSNAEKDPCSCWPVRRRRSHQLTYVFKQSAADRAQKDALSGRPDENVAPLPLPTLIVADIVPRNRGG